MKRLHKVLFILPILGLVMALASGCKKEESTSTDSSSTNKTTETKK